MNKESRHRKPDGLKHCPVFCMVKNVLENMG